MRFTGVCHDTLPWLISFSLGLMERVEEIEVRPFSSRKEYELILDYFYKADDPFLR
jgi:hypothetical protein